MSETAAAPEARPPEAPSPVVHDETRHLTGKQRVAILLLAAGRERAVKVLKQLQEDEVRDVSVAMAGLGLISASVVEEVCAQFTKNFESSEGLVGTYETTEELLRKALSGEQVDKIMEEIRGPAGRTMWDKLGNVQEMVLANYLRNEYPQTAAVILSRLQPAHAARVLTLLPEDYATEVMMRVLHMETVQREVLDSVEATLRSEFISSLGRSSKRDSYELLAEVFNNFDRKTETRLMASMDKRNHADMEKVKALMFTFEDIKRLPHEALMRIVAQVDREKLPLALKGASETVRKMFLQCMSKRAGSILLEEISALGPVRVKDADAAQVDIVTIIKNMANAGEIDLTENGGNDEIIP
ncbi:flagellar motor switch protein FliG [Acetobacter fabarum]|jgi:flagellar motor switch protein FliG|uniref:Flagellar motor switch protein FliG n=1 Tax=Acetobacter fabarum TaxID=483199 RepID=A0A269XYD8_9PROT|nr:MULTISPECIES: flagellar motor switch protein FliG [Acetobacter]MDN6713719.1 flagellar motor switch protein FliG [Acetobacter sp.]MCH4025126.1 flagellar motor switch protein FliG [Acetobacter fabarum]MCH4055508.1 flagellar motor switch protein FliG [Acetobacter fabarum]MCH4127972.1 flagellar motor switch protein FliG [Acetobacter fabarum]MCH4141183.1 flagellar motor switch protein FliG [Acetobacter fabarum]